MAINTIPISARTHPWDQSMSAGGGFTLPRHVFFPHPSTQPISSGHIPQPSTGMAPTVAVVTTANLFSRPLPGTQGSGVYGIRSMHFKASPG